MTGKVLVTGSEGFLGRHCCEHLRGMGHEVAGYDLPRGDILDRSALAKALRGKDLCVHLAAMANLHECREATARAERVNVLGTEQLARACCEAGVGLLFVSTACIYGNNGYGIQVETNPVAPTEHYSRTKWRGEKALEALAQSHGLDYLILRPATFYGPGMRKALAIYRLLSAHLEGAPVTIEGSGEQTRSYTHVRDVAGAIGLLLRRWPEDPCRIYNCAGGETHSVLELLELCQSVAGRSVARCHVQDREGQIRRSQIDSSRLRALGWRPQISLRRGLLDLRLQLCSRRPSPLECAGKVQLAGSPRA